MTLTKFHIKMNIHLLYLQFNVCKYDLNKDIYFRFWFIPLSIFTNKANISLFGAASKWVWSGQKSPLLTKTHLIRTTLHISYNHETWRNYVLPKKDSKNI